MKKNIIKGVAISIIALSMLGLNSCRQELDINADPNNPTDVPSRTLLAGSEINIGYIVGGTATRMPASIIQHYGGHRGQPLDYARFNITSSETDTFWTNSYDVLMDLNALEEKSIRLNDKIYQGIAQILKAYTFSILTDSFGDIPFKDALQGAKNINPSYDKQELIYQELIKMIDNGIANVKSNLGNKPTSDDFIFAGNIQKWEMFGNSLKLRLYNHLSKKNPNAAASFLATNPVLIESSANNAKVTFGISASNANPIYQFDVLSGRKDQAVSKTIVDKMLSLNDPRVSVYFTKITKGSTFVGQIRGNEPGGDTDDSGESLYSRVGSAYASINSPVILMSAAEVNFIKAEIYHRAGDLTNSKIAYENAIKEDFSALGVSDSSLYISTSNVSFNGTLERIMEQKWITMYQASYESWVDWRRTGFPQLVAPVINRTSDVFPRRLPYPQVEINVNGAALLAGPGIPVPFETLKTKVWWDQ